MADVWANSMACHPRATCHIAGCSHLAKSMSWSCHITGCKNSIRHIENRFRHILFFLFGLWRAEAFVSSPIHLYRYRHVLGVCQDFPLGGVQRAQGQEPDLHRMFAFQWDIWRSYGRISMKFYASKITEKRVHRFAWNVACRQMSGHGRTDQLLSPIRIIVRIAFSNIISAVLCGILRRENPTYT